MTAPAYFLGCSDPHAVTLTAQDTADFLKYQWQHVEAMGSSHVIHGDPCRAWDAVGGLVAMEQWQRVALQPFMLKARAWRSGANGRWVSGYCGIFHSITGNNTGTLFNALKPSDRVSWLTELLCWQMLGATVLYVDMAEHGVLTRDQIDAGDPGNGMQMIAYSEIGKDTREAFAAMWTIAKQHGITLGTEPPPMVPAGNMIPPALATTWWARQNLTQTCAVSQSILKATVVTLDYVKDSPDNVTEDEARRWHGLGVELAATAEEQRDMLTRAMS